VVRFGLLPALFCLATIFTHSLTTLAANPSSGTISPNYDYLHWYGKETAASSATDESTCIEGVNCDTFYLTISGAPSDWVGKIATVNIFWGVRSSDYDLYIHRGTNAGPLVASSAHGATDSDGVQEQITLEPSITGTGEFTIHVVYFATTGNSYNGSVSVSLKIDETPTPTPLPTPSPTPLPTPVPNVRPNSGPVPNDPSNPSCTLPGVLVIDDPAGDTASGLSAHDLRSVSVAEPGDLTDKMVFTIKVGDLSLVPPNSEWRLEFSGFWADYYWISMNTLDPLRGAVFYYGHYEYVAGQRKSFTDGEADAGTYSPDGTIRITVGNGKVGNFIAGETIYGFLATIRAFEGVPYNGLTGEMDTSRMSQGYQVVGNRSCNYLPTVSLTNPLGGAVFNTGSDITITADAADSDGTISKVEFFQNGTKLGESTASPYSLTWTNVPSGTYTLTARATDNVGATATSASIDITVRIPPPAAPSNLSATGIGNSGLNKSVVTLAWNDNSDNEQSFLIERSTSSAGGFVEIGTVSANINSFADRDVQSKTTYYYRVRATNSTGHSAYSNTASVHVK
jgi:hypothetical protein